MALYYSEFYCVAVISRSRGKVWHPWGWTLQGLQGAPGDREPLSGLRQHQNDSLPAATAAEDRVFCLWRCPEISGLAIGPREPAHRLGSHPVSASKHARGLRQ